MVATVDETPELDIGKILPGAVFAAPGIDKPNLCQRIETVVCWGESFRICELS